MPRDVGALIAELDAELYKLSEHFTMWEGSEKYPEELEAHKRATLESLVSAGCTMREIETAVRAKASE